jgi:hypothetical protein
MPVVTHLVQNNGQCKDERPVYAWADPRSIRVPPEQCTTCCVLACNLQGKPRYIKIGCTYIT